MLKSIMAPICDKLCTDKRMGTPVLFKQLILLSPVRPPAFTLNATSHSLFRLFPLAKVYHVFFVRSKEKRVEPWRCSFMRANPSSASHDPIVLVALQSSTAFSVSTAPLENMLVSVCTATANSLYAVWAVAAPFFSPGFPCFSGHCEAQCGPLQMMHFCSCLLLGRSRCPCC